MKIHLESCGIYNFKMGIDMKMTSHVHVTFQHHKIVRMLHQLRVNLLIIIDDITVDNIFAMLSLQYQLPSMPKNWT